MNMNPGTLCYKVAAIHIDRISEVVLFDCLLGIADADGKFVATAAGCVRHQLPYTDFLKAFTNDGQPMLDALGQICSDFPADTASNVPGLKGYTYTS
jgi:hypothetical protein